MMEILSRPHSSPFLYGDVGRRMLICVAWGVVPPSFPPLRFHCWASTTHQVLVYNWSSAGSRASALEKLLLQWGQEGQTVHQKSMSHVSGARTCYAGEEGGEDEARWRGWGSAG